MPLTFSYEESRFIIRVWGGKPHRKKKCQAKDQKQGLWYDLGWDKKKASNPKLGTRFDFSSKIQIRC